MFISCFRHSEDLLAYDCPVPFDQLNPAHQLQWNISMETVKEIEAAKIHIDRLVNFSTNPLWKYMTVYNETSIIGY